MMNDPRQKISFVKLNLICIVSGYHDASGYTYYSRRRQNQVEESNYIIIFLFCEIGSSTGQVVYIIEVKSSKKSIWGRNYHVRDNIIFTIDSYITAFNPFPILNRLVNDIPILKS